MNKSDPNFEKKFIARFYNQPHFSRIITVTDLIISVQKLCWGVPKYPTGFLLPLLLLETPDRSSSTLQTVQKWLPTYSAPRDSRHILVDAPLSLLAPDCPEVILFVYVRGFYSSVYSPLTVIVNSLSEEDNGTVSSARFCRAPFTPGRYLSVL